MRRVLTPRAVRDIQRPRQGAKRGDVDDMIRKRSSHGNNVACYTMFIPILTLQAARSRPSRYASCASSMQSGAQQSKSQSCAALPLRLAHPSGRCLWRHIFDCGGLSLDELAVCRRIAPEVFECEPVEVVGKRRPMTAFFMANL